MSDITTVLTASVTLISAFPTLSPMHNGLCCVFIMTLLFLLLVSSHNRQKHGKSLKPPSLLPSSDMVLFLYSVQ